MWNEWGEGNYVEPDLKYSHGWLDALRNELFYIRLHVSLVYHPILQLRAHGDAVLGQHLCPAAQTGKL